MVNFKKALATVMVASLAFPSVAFATTYNNPSVSRMRDTGGTTDLKVVLATSGEDNSSNENITFTVPTSINFAMKADGTLIAPSPSAIYVENESVFSIGVAGFSYEPNDSWNLSSYMQDAYVEPNNEIISNVSFGSDGVTNTYSLGVSAYAGEDNYLTSSDILNLYNKANNLIDAHNTIIKNGEEDNDSSGLDEYYDMLAEIGNSADEVFLHDTSNLYDFSVYRQMDYKSQGKIKPFQYGEDATTTYEKTIMLPNIVHNTKGIGLEDNKANFSFVGLAANVTKDLSSPDKLGTVIWVVYTKTNVNNNDTGGK